MAKRRTTREADPSTRSAAYMRMFPVWEKIDTVLAGSQAMRDAGERYLPRHEHEKDKRYQDRRASAVLYNATKQTLDSWVGRPFSDPVQIGEDVSEEVKAWLDDVDLQGNAVGVFARTWFREGLAKGLAHVLVDSPDFGDDDRPRTVADDVRENARPYWSFIRPENLIFASSVVEQGKEILTHARIREQVVSRVGFGEDVVDRIRIFDRVFEGTSGGDEAGVYYSIWEHQKDERGKRSWVQVQPPRKIGIGVIPIVTFYASRVGFMEADSPIEDLADLNIRHWQSYSDQINILTASRFPMLALSGGTDEDATRSIGPWSLLYTADAKGKFYYVEHEGAAIAAGRTDLKDLEEQMASYGADYLRKRSGSATATARALDSAEATSPLQDAVVRFNDAMQTAFDLMGAWRAIDDMGTISVAVDFGPESVVRDDLSSLVEARKLGDLSRADFLAELRRRGVLGDEFDQDENARHREEEAGEVSGEVHDTDIDPEAEE